MRRSWDEKRLTRARPGNGVDIPHYLLDLVVSEKASPSVARGILLRVVFRVTNRGDAMPTGEVLAAIIGYESGHGTVRPLKQLEDRGLIKIDRHTRSRRVQHLVTKKWSRPCTDKSVHWRYDDNRMKMECV